MYNLSKTIVALLLFFCSWPLLSIEIDFRGYGSINASYHSEPIDFLGVEEDFSFYSETRLAGLLNIYLSDNFSLTYQGKVASDYLKPSNIIYSNDLAFMSYQLLDNLRFRLGRLRSPFYLNSEFIETNYLLPWSRSPATVYRQLPLYNYDGIDAIYTTPIGNQIDIKLQAVYGKREFVTVFTDPLLNQTGKISIEADNVNSINLSVFVQDWTARLSYTRATLDMLDTLPYYIPKNAVPYEQKGIFATAALKYEDDNYLFMGEYASRKLKNSFAIDPIQGFYVTAGYKILNFMPSISYGRSKTPTGISTQQGISSDMDFLTTTIKWDIAENFDIKAEFSHYRDRAKNAREHSFIDRMPDGSSPGGINLFSLSLNFIF